MFYQIPSYWPQQVSSKSRTLFRGLWTIYFWKSFRKESLEWWGPARKWDKGESIFQFEIWNFVLKVPCIKSATFSRYFVSAAILDLKETAISQLLYKLEDCNFDRWCLSWASTKLLAAILKISKNFFKMVWLWGLSVLCFESSFGQVSVKGSIEVKKPLISLTNNCHSAAPAKTLHQYSTSLHIRC